MRRGPGGVSFVVLDGDAEARLELGAVRHYRPTQGLFAGGGKSIQVGSGFGAPRPGTSGFRLFHTSAHQALEVRSL